MNRFTLHTVATAPAASQALLAAGYTRQTVLEVILGTRLKVMPNCTIHVVGTAMDAPLRAHAWQAAQQGREAAASVAQRSGRSTAALASAVDPTTARNAQLPAAQLLAAAGLDDIARRRSDAMTTNPARALDPP